MGNWGMNLVSGLLGDHEQLWACPPSFCVSVCECPFLGGFRTRI